MREGPKTTNGAPATTQPGVAGLAARAPQPGASGKPLRILHLEDDPDYSELVREMLEQDGLSVELVLVGNYADFVRNLENAAFDLILADYWLPDCTGIQALQAARQKSPDTPVLLLSGALGEQAAIESLKCGATDYVLKHWPERLVPAIRRAIKDSLERAQRRELESQLRQAQKMEAFGQLAGGVAHDFNNLLVVIRGNTEIALMSSDPLSDETRECLKQVTAAAERAANLTRQLLAFGRKQAMQFQPLNLNDVLGNLARMLDRIIGENIRLQCTYEPEPPFVQADVGMMEQVLVNLVVNARDAMPQGGQLFITPEKTIVDAAYVGSHPEAREGDFVCLSVRDTGTGIAPEHLPRIFEPFFTTKEAGKGTGLGLATVYGIIKQHQGWIEVSSGVAGTTFKIFLPAIPQPVTGAASRPAEPVRRGGTERILVVEDDAAVRTLTKRILETFGYRVWEAGTGVEALELWRHHFAEIDLLVTDIIMPDGITGHDLAKQLRAQKPGLGIIFVSGYSSEVVGKDPDFLHAAKSHFLQKPYPSHLLLDTVRKCLDEK